MAGDEGLHVPSVGRRGPKPREPGWGEPSPEDEETASRCVSKRQVLAGYRRPRDPWETPEALAERRVRHTAERRAAYASEGEGARLGRWRGWVAHEEMQRSLGISGGATAAEVWAMHYDGPPPAAPVDPAPAGGLAQEVATETSDASPAPLPEGQRVRVHGRFGPWTGVVMWCSGNSCRVMPDADATRPSLDRSFCRDVERGEVEVIP